MDSTYQELKNKKIQENINRIASKYKNKKILLFGAGVISEYLFDNYDLSSLNIIGIVDSRFSEGQPDFKNFKTFIPDKMDNLNADVILITAYDYAQIIHFLKQYYPQITKLPIEHILPTSFLGKIKTMFGL